jgi:glycerophosphoryl diester phosphodiesterase
VSAGTFFPGVSRTLVLGHRGAPLLATENTLPAFARAREAGADGVELDVQRSLEGVPVVLHDDSLARTMSVTGLVSALRWPAIERLVGARVPSFAQAAAWAAASEAWLNVEIKAPGTEAEVLRILEELGLRSRTFISSFDAEVVGTVGSLDPSFPRFLLAERWDDRAAAAFARTGAHGICLRVDAATDPTLSSLSVPVVVWTVNDPLTCGRLLRAGVAGIITDDPAMAVRERARFEERVPSDG